MTILWLVIFIVLIFLELITTNFVSIWFAIGALITTFASLVIDNSMIELAIFTITSLILLLITRKFVSKIKPKGHIPTNLDQVIGKTGVVTEDILEDEIGEVKVLGKRWSAVSDKKIVKDSKVKILSIDGVKLKVELIKESDK